MRTYSFHVDPHIHYGHVLTADGLAQALDRFRRNLSARDVDNVAGASAQEHEALLQLGEIARDIN